MARIIRLLFVLIFFVIGKLNAQERIVQISTNFGTMKFRLYNDTPKHRDAFIDLAREGYYNETLFYRVIPSFLIQGGSKSSKNAPPGKRIGYGDPDKTVDDEILKTHFHKKGTLCAPRQPDDVNPFKQSDISQFYIIEGKVYSNGELDTLELAVNQPIQQKITQQYLTQEIRQQLKELKEQNKVKEFREIADEVKAQIKAEYNLQTGTLEFSPEQRKAYTTIGGYPDLDGKYTVFGECIEGLDVIDKIASLETDENNRPYTDVKIQVAVIQ